MPGRFGWEGGLGTAWASDPNEELVAILMTQCLPPVANLHADFWTSAYAAIAD